MESTDSIRCVIAVTDPSSCQRGRYKITNSNCLKENLKEKEKLVAGPGWAPDRLADWLSVVMWLWLWLLTWDVSWTSNRFQSQSHVTTDGQSVSMSWCQVHSGTCDQILFSVWKLLCCWEVGSVSCQSVSQCLVHCQRFNIIYIVNVTCFKYMQYILYVCQHRLSTADHAKISATTAV
jgi:hypothetical protein